MATKKPVARAGKTKEEKALVLHEIALSTRADLVIRAETPEALIKSKPGRGGKRVSFVEGGYVISQLNAAFSPVGWEFDVVDQGQSDRKTETNAEGEVWVRGKLAVIDHKNGWRVFKTQYGQHPIHKNVPIGDAFKAAGTDALKKCASLFGIALDVYWGQLDAPEARDPKESKPKPAELFERAKMMVAQTKNVDALAEYQEKLATQKGSLTPTQKRELIELVKSRIAAIQEAA